MSAEGRVDDLLEKNLIVEVLSYLVFEGGGCIILDYEGEFLVLRF